MQQIPTKAPAPRQRDPEPNETARQMDKIGKNNEIGSPMRDGEN